jgi:hypothetical protein
MAGDCRDRGASASSAQIFLRGALIVEASKSHADFFAAAAAEGVPPGALQSEFSRFHQPVEEC